MKLHRGRMGSTTVEAAILFPMIIFLAVSGFSLMAAWYSQWEAGMERHATTREEDGYSESLQILHWEQWNQFLEGSDDGKG